MPASPGGAAPARPGGARPIHDPVAEARVEASPGLPPRPTLRREWLLLGISLLVLAATVAPPLINLSRYQHRIVTAMSGSLGRPVAMRAVTLRLLPTPALVLDDVEVGEEPGFGAEPALRAPNLTAELRLTSLWRGRLEVSRVEMSEASLNLVRDGSGHWNIGSVLLQASHVSNAPTGQRRPGAAPRFPYIEITDSRVNVKQGVEKLPYSLLNANLSIWLAEPDVWQVKLAGQPVRTDLALGLADTGLLRVEGRIHRATAPFTASLGHMPLALHADWANAPLGQASRLLRGSDPGWRGELRATADVAGELDQLRIAAHLMIVDLHREEFTPAQPFVVDMTCRGEWQRAAHRVNDLACRWPVGDGQMLLTGSAGTTQEGDRSLVLTADRLPASFALAAAGLARSDFAPTFRMDGVLSGAVRYGAVGGGAPVYSGGLDSDGLRVVAGGLAEPLMLNDVRMSAATPSPTGLPTLLLSAAPLDMDGPTRVAVEAQLTEQGFLLHAGGSASVQRLLELGSATHLVPLAMARLRPLGTADFDLTRSAGWQAGEAAGMRPSEPGPARQGVAPARAGARFLGVGIAGMEPQSAATSGWLRLRDVSYAPPFLAAPVVVAAAQATFVPGKVDWKIPAASVAGARLQVTVSYPVECQAEAGCAAHFHVSAGTLGAEQLRAAVLGESHLLDQLLSGLDNRSVRWPAMVGTVHADTFALGRLLLRDADAKLSIREGQVAIESLDAQTLGGTLHGSGTVTRQGRTPGYELKMELTRASATAAGSLFRENWGAGAISVGGEVKLAGASTAELADSAAGKFHAEWTRGGLGADTPLAHFADWSAEGTIGYTALTLTHSELLPAPGAQLPRSTPLALTGSIGFDRALTLDAAPTAAATHAGEGLKIVGTLAHPLARLME